MRNRKWYNEIAEEYFNDFENEFFELIPIDGERFDRNEIFRTLYLNAYQERWIKYLRQAIKDSCGFLEKTVDFSLIQNSNYIKNIFNK